MIKSESASEVKTKGKRKPKSEGISQFLHSLPVAFEELGKRAALTVQRYRAELHERDKDDARLRIVLQQRVMVLDHLKNVYIEDSPDRDLLIRKGYIRVKKEKAD